MQIDTSGLMVAGYIETNNMTVDVNICDSVSIIRGDSFIYTRIGIKSHYLQTEKSTPRRLIRKLIKQILTNPSSFNSLSVLE